LHKKKQQQARGNQASESKQERGEKKTDHTTALIFHQTTHSRFLHIPGQQQQQKIGLG
jgi:hypothetical protein